MATLENLNFTFLQNIFHPIVLTGFGFPFWHMKLTALKTRKGLPYLWGCSYSQCLLFQTVLNKIYKNCTVCVTYAEHCAKEWCPRCCQKIYYTTSFRTLYCHFWLALICESVFCMHKYKIWVWKSKHWE